MNRSPQWTGIYSLIICLILTCRGRSFRPHARGRCCVARSILDKPAASMSGAHRIPLQDPTARSRSLAPGPQERWGHRCQPPIEKVGACPTRAQEVRSCTPRGRVGRRACRPRSRLVATTACLRICASQFCVRHSITTWPARSIPSRLINGRTSLASRSALRFSVSVSPIDMHGYLF
jgi:hypothetical protein